MENVLPDLNSVALSRDILNINGSLVDRYTLQKNLFGLPLQ